MKIHKITIGRLIIASAISLISSLFYTNVTRAGEGGIAGSAAFTIEGGTVTGVAVSAAVGKESAAAHSFNYDASNDNGLQNSAFAIGTAGTLSINGLGDPAGFTLETQEDSDRDTAQVNTFTTGGTFDIQIGTTSGNTVVDLP